MQTKPKIVIEVCFLNDQYFRRGIGRYGREMAKRYVENLTGEYEIYLIGLGDLESNLELLEVSPTPKPQFVSIGRPSPSKPISNIFNYYFKIRKAIKEINPDIYIAMQFERGLPSDLVPTFVAIHDVIPIATGKYSSKGPILNWLKGIFYNFMFEKTFNSTLFTSSQFSKQDIVRNTSIPEENVEVVYLGISDVFENVTKDQPNLLSKFFLQFSELPKYLIYDAGFEANKNSSKLLELLAKLDQDYYLVITGGDFEGGKAINERAGRFMNHARQLQIQERVIPVGRVSEQDLANLLANSAAYINLSNYEGFGFGPLQAMKARVPAIVSNRTSFKEICEGAALLIEPEKIDIEKVKDLLTNQQTRDNLIQKGLNRATNFTWDNTFTQTWNKIKQRQKI